MLNVRWRGAREQRTVDYEPVSNCRDTLKLEILGVGFQRLLERKKLRS